MNVLAVVQKPSKVPTDLNVMIIVFVAIIILLITITLINNKK
jgi:hypothetical protein